MRNRSLLATSTLASVLAAVASPVEAAQTLGHVGPPQPGTADATAFQPSTAFPPTFVYAIPAEGGVITQWSTRAGQSGGIVKLKILEPARGGQFQVVAESAPVAIAAGATVTTAASIPVGGGGRLGLRSQGLAPTTTDGARPDDVAAFAPTADPPIASAFSPASSAGGLLVNVSVVIEPDPDVDGLGDETQDNCPAIANRAQVNTDSDAQGDACDADDDNDGLDDARELVTGTNPLRGDSDGDGRGDTADNCPILANPRQEDTDRSGGGDACDADDDQDGLTDVQEDALKTSSADRDSDDDGLADEEEVRRTRTNPARVDSDRDRVTDGVELARFQLIPPRGRVGGTDRRRFRRDRDLGTRTDPRRTDTDRDGLGDGREDANRNGRRDRGETDPRLRDTDRDGRSDRLDRRPVDRRRR